MEMENSKRSVIQKSRSMDVLTHVRLISFLYFLRFFPLRALFTTRPVTIKSQVPLDHDGLLAW